MARISAQLRLIGLSDSFTNLEFRIFEFFDEYFSAPQIIT